MGKCKCGYEGELEVGDFGLDPNWLIHRHFRCPKCKSTSMDRIEYTESFEVIMEAYKFPRTCTGHEGRVHAPAKYAVGFCVSGNNPKTVGYHTA